MQLMMKAENNSNLDIEKELNMLNEKYDKKKVSARNRTKTYNG